MEKGFDTKMKPWELKCTKCDNIIFNGECCYIGIGCNCGGSYEKDDQLGLYYQGKTIKH